MDNENLDGFNVPNSPFTFSGVAPENLGSPEYTLVLFSRDKSGSTCSFEDELTKAQNSSLDACRKSPRAENILVKCDTFNAHVTEEHGFMELAKIPDYANIRSGGDTALYDAVMAGLGSIKSYSDKLKAMDFSVNAIIFITTDGMDNASTYKAADIKKFIEDTLTKEEVGRITTVLIGVNDQNGLSTYLSDFQKEAGLTKYISLGDATPSKLAKLAEFISRSISSSSQSLAQGSGNIDPNSLNF